MSQSARHDSGEITRPIEAAELRKAIADSEPPKSERHKCPECRGVMPHAPAHPCISCWSTGRVDDAGMARWHARGQGRP